MILNQVPVSFCVNQGTASEVGAKLQLMCEFVREIEACELVFLADALP